MAVFDLGQLMSSAIDLPGSANSNIPSPWSGWTSYQPLPPSDYNPAAITRNALNANLNTIRVLQNSLASTTDPALAAQLRQHLEKASSTAQSLRAGLAGPKLTPPSLVGRPPVGLVGEEEYLRQRREGLPPPEQSE